MSEWRHVRSLGVERPGQAYFFGYDEAPPGDGQVRLDLLYTGFSAGTELTFVKNSNPYLHSRWDAGRGVFVPGEPSAHYPVPFLGYMEVAASATAGSTISPTATSSAPSSGTRPAIPPIRSTTC